MKSPLYKRIVVKIGTHVLTKENGLSHNSIECILADSEGFIWFGTRNGLCRFDGYQMKVFRNTISENSISGNRILSIAEDKNGNLWIGTYQNGLNKFNKRTNKFTHFGEEKQIGNQVYRIKVLSDSTVYIGSSKGLALYNNKTDSFKIYQPDNTANGLNSYLVSDILETKNGEIFIATWESAIMRFEKSTGKFFTINYITHHKQTVNYRKRLLEDKDGNIWVGTGEGVVIYYNPNDVFTVFCLVFSHNKIEFS